jgi:crotonobetainyl-CoA:carnitine CoA-transferase CaiB-like acyl-CoA transferase
MGAVLEGVKIIDLTTVLAGPFPTQMLAELGADVIKVESPGGDTVRDIGPFLNERMGALFLQANRGKRAITLDLKQAAGRDILLRLIENADIFVHNMRPRAISALGLTYAELKKVNEKLIYVGLFGFDQRGPYANRPAYDDLIQGLSAIPDLVQRSGNERPRYAPIAIADRYTGMAAYAAILGAYTYQLRTGRGQEVSVPMFETMAHLVLSDHLGGETFPGPVGPIGYARLLSNNRAPYRTKDGFICLIVYNDKQWRRFFQAIGREDKIDSDPRFANMASRARHIDALYGEIAELLPERTTAEWLDILEAADIPVMPMHTLETLLEDEQLAASGLIYWKDHPTQGRVRCLGTPTVWSESQPSPGSGAPEFGQHTLEILRELSLSETEVAKLLADGVAVGRQVRESGQDENDHAVAHG